MPRGHYQRKAREELVEQPPPAEVDSFRALVDALPAATEPGPDPEPSPEAETSLPAIVACEIAAAYRDGRYGDAASLSVLANRMGELKLAIPSVLALSEPALTIAVQQLSRLL